MGADEISVEVRARNADAIRYAIPVYWGDAFVGESAANESPALPR